MYARPRVSQYWARIEFARVAWIPRSTACWLRPWSRAPREAFARCDALRAFSVAAASTKPRPTLRNAIAERLALPCEPTYCLALRDVPRLFVASAGTGRRKLIAATTPA